MARIVSFIVLAAIVVLFGALFVQVMARFLLPIFLALVLVVMFRPLHQWFELRTGGRTRVAALLTTLVILLIVLVPMLLLVARAASDGAAMGQGFDRDELMTRLKEVRRRLYLAQPNENVRAAHDPLQQAVEGLESITGEIQRSRRTQAPLGEIASEAHLDEHLQAFLQHEASLSQFVGAGDAIAHLPKSAQEPVSDKRRAAELHTALAQLKQRVEELGEVTREGLRLPPPRPAGAAAPANDAAPENADFDAESERLVREVDAAQATLRSGLMGPPLLAWLRQQANPDAEQDRLDELRDELQRVAGPLALSTTQAVGGFLGKFMVGLGIMIISLYYFLADGPAMVNTIMRLSPLEERYERQMLTEFDKVCRAVVVATLLSAMVQGLLAGVGYWAAGLDGVFLLSVITMVLAMVPFVGAAAVWGSCAVWLLLYDERTVAAALLALYGVAVVSMADNVIKPIVLHGQSNIHPLLALLSVIGGVTALGPIGIFVGPMAVAFLHALLFMLDSELKALSALETPKPSKTLD